jgi:O-antigen/teichoic acid export membrane protein
LASSEPAAAEDGARLGFVGNVNLVLLSYVASAALAFVATVLVSRALGPEGRGIYALFLLTVSLTQVVVSLGVGVSAVYFIGKGTYPLARIVANTQQVALASAVLAVALVVLAVPTVGDALLDRGVPYWAFAFMLPLFLNYGVLTSVLQGASRFVAMNALIVLQPLVLVALLAVALASGDVTTGEALVYWSIATAAAVAIGLVALGAAFLSRELVRFDWPSIWEQIRFGVQGQIGNLVQLLNYRLDQYIVLLFVNAAGVGIYAVAVAVSQSVWFVSNAVATVLLPRLTAAGEDDAARTTPVACRNTLLLSALAAGALAILAPFIVEPIFGEDFAPAVTPLLWLLPGAVALAGSKILASYVFSRGYPLVNSAITVGALVVTLGADFALIPALGVTGAAIASSLAYCAHFALSLVAYRRLSGGSLREAVVVGGADLRMYADFARRLAPAKA